MQLSFCVGKKDTYIRTWFAFEQGSIPADRFEEVIATNGDADHWEWETVATDVKIGGNEYVIAKATYLGPTSNPTGILTPNATTYPSLLQVYMKPEATNEDVEEIDGNNNGTYDILVGSQAVQTDGFDGAEEALTAAFTDEHPWNDLTIAQVNDEVSTSLDGDLYLIDRPYYNEYKDIEENLVIDGNGYTVYQEVSTFKKINEWGNAEPYEGNRSMMGNLFVSKPGSTITVKDITFKGEMSSVQLGYWDGPCDFHAILENVNLLDLEVINYNQSKGQALAIYGTAILKNVKITGTKKSSLDDREFTIYDIRIINGTTTIEGGRVGSIYIDNNLTSLTIKDNAIIDKLVVAGKDNISKVHIEDGVTIKEIVDTNGNSLVLE